MSIPQPKSNRPAVLFALCLAVACGALVVVVSRGRTEQSKLRSELAALQKRLNPATIKAPPPPAADKNLRQRQPEPTGSPPAEDTASPAAATASDVKSESKRRLDADAMSSAMKSPMMQKIIASQTATMTQMTYSQQEPEHKEISMFDASLAEGESLDPGTSDALANLQSDARKQFPFTVDFYDQRNFGNTAVLNAAAVQKFLEEQAQFHSQVAEKAAVMLTPTRLELFKQNQSAARQMTTMQLNSIVQLAGGER